MPDNPILIQANETAAWLRPFFKGVQPNIAIVLGSGLGKLREQMQVDTAIPYAQIPHFPLSTVEGHAGEFLIGQLGGQNVIALSGRFHYYEGYPMQQVTFPVRVLHALGVHYYFASNAAGGTNPGFHVGDIMMITDHINFFPEHPLRGKNIEYGPRFPEMSQTYSPKLQQLACEVADEQRIALQKGIYLGNQGPTYETPSEYRMYRLLGADAVGMSTVPEIIVARHCGMECFGVSVITNSGQKNAFTSHEEVKEAADSASDNLAKLFVGVIQRLNSNK